MLPESAGATRLPRWPSFSEAIGKSVHLRDDRSHGMVRIEALCTVCGGHLGHLFDDGPRDRGGLRYCVNSASLVLDRAEAGEAAPDGERS